MTDSPNPRPVAVLDDDVQFIRMVERILKTEQIEIQPVTTPDLDEAVGVVATTNCRLALVDIYIYGEAAGFELIERLRAHPTTSGLPIIVTSGAYREIARRVPFLQQYNCSILPKPFEVDALMERIYACEALEVSRDGVEAALNPEDWGPHRTAAWRSLMNPLRHIERTA